MKINLSARMPDGSLCEANLYVDVEWKPIEGAAKIPVDTMPMKVLEIKMSGSGADFVQAIEGG